LLGRLLGIGISQADCQQDAAPDQFNARDQGRLAAGLTKPCGQARYRHAVQSQHALPDGPSLSDRVGAEQDPGHTDGQERHGHGHRLGQAQACFHPEPVQADEQPVQQPPQHESPGRSMPEAADDHGKGRCQQSSGKAVAVAAQRDIDVVAQEPGQRPVPALPEVGDADRLIRGIEVLRQSNAEQQADADGHVRIAREVEIDLQAIADRGHPGFEERQDGIGRKQRIDMLGDAVGDDAFLKQADREQEQPLGELPGVKRHALAQLRHDVRVVQDRAGDQVREERNREREAPRTEVLDLTLVAVDQPGDDLKGEKRQAQWQHQLKHRVGRADGQIPVFQPEIGVLKIAEQTDVIGQPHDQQRPGPGFRYLLAQVEIADGVADQQGHIARVPPAVEVNRAEDHEPLRIPFALQGVQAPPARDGERQEKVKEFRRIKQHKAAKTGLNKAVMLMLPLNACRVKRHRF